MKFCSSQRLVLSNSYNNQVQVILLDSQTSAKRSHKRFNLLSANFTKCSNILKQFVAKLPTNCLSVFDHFVGLAFKGLKKRMLSFDRKQKQVNNER